MSKITIKEIAKELGMSISTISRALNDSYQISEPTKVKVRAFAEKHNYRPDPIATSLRDRKSKTICVIVPELANVFFSQVASGIDQYANEKGYNIFIYQSLDLEEKEAKGINFGLDRRADGFLVSLSGSTLSNEHFHLLKNSEVPVVYFDRVPPGIDADKVVVDNFVGAYEGTKSLIKQGCKRIANISIYGSLNITKERIEGYKKCLLNNNIEVDESIIKYTTYDQIEVKKIVEDILSDPTIDGFMINNGRLALIVLSAIKSSLLYHTMKLKIAAFINEFFPELLSPSITAIRQPSLEMGQKSAQLLISRLEAKDKKYPFQTLILPTQIIE